MDSIINKTDLELEPEKILPALLHSSYVNEKEIDSKSNERLEFLGDAVLDLVISDYLFSKFKDKDEGELSQIKSVVVSQPVLADKAEKLHLGDHLKLGKGEEESGGRNKPSILSDALEALIGVIFKEKGFEDTSKFVLNIMEEEIKSILEKQNVLDYKSALQIQTQKIFGDTPNYELIEEKGKPNNRIFCVSAHIKDYKGKGRGRTKKEAEEAAAKQVYLAILREEESATVAD